MISTEVRGTTPSAAICPDAGPLDSSDPAVLQRRKWKGYLRAMYAAYAKPPFARITCALIHPPSGPARKETALAMSSG